MRGVEEILKLVCTFLNERKIPYVIIGGFAVMFHGNPRTTMDIDYIVRLSHANMENFVKFLSENGFYASKDDMQAAFNGKSHCSVEDKETMFRLDIKGVYTKVDRRTLENRVGIKYDDTTIYIASAEDTIASKLLFASEQDVSDALGIYVRQEGMDADYLEEVCRMVGVYAQLEDLKRHVESSQ